jgi:hypothetical protein
LTEADLLRRIAVTHQAAISEKTGLSTSHINRIASGKAGLTLEHVVPFLRAIGLAVTPIDGEMVSLSREEYEALRTLARKALG